MKKLYLTLISLVLICLEYSYAQLFPAESPSPDEYGYTWKTNLADDGPAFNWIDITEVGIEVTGLSDDNIVGPFPMGIEFQYYWVNHQEVFIGSNGYISFQNGNIASSLGGFPPTPTPDDRNDIIAPFMVDLTLDGAGNPGEVYFFSDIDSQRFIVSFIDVPFWNRIEQNEFLGSNSFQVILDARDSSITYQYAAQEGFWDAGYDDEPNPMVVGIENVTGQIGLLVANNILPLPGTAVRFDPPNAVSLNVPDVAPQSLINEASQGIIIPPSDPLNPDFFLDATIVNTGNIDIESPTQVEARVLDSVGQLVFQESISIESFEIGQEEDVQFTIPFNPPLPGTYTYEVTTTNADDINNFNNSQTTEIVVVDTTNATARYSYNSENVFNIDGSVSWTGNNNDSGAGIFFESFGYPIIIDTLSFLVLADPNPVEPASRGFRMELYQAIPGVAAPGQLVFTRDITLEELVVNTDSSGWTNIPLEQEVVILEGGFYVSWIQLDPVFSLATETTPPISRRTFEILSGKWAQYRRVGIEDFYIRVSVDVSFATPTSIRNTIPGLQQFNVYPNPSNGLFTLALDLEQAQSLTITLTDLQGRTIHQLKRGRNNRFYEELNFSSIAKGMYMLEVQTNKGRISEKIVIQ